MLKFCLLLSVITSINAIDPQCSDLENNGSIPKWNEHFVVEYKEFDTNVSVHKVFHKSKNFKDKNNYIDIQDITSKKKKIGMPTFYYKLSTYEDSSSINIEDLKKKIKFQNTINDRIMGPRIYTCGYNMSTGQSFFVMGDPHNGYSSYDTDENFIEDSWHPIYVTTNKFIQSLKEILNESAKACRTEPLNLLTTGEINKDEQFGKFSDKNCYFFYDEFAPPELIIEHPSIFDIKDDSTCKSEVFALAMSWLIDIFNKNGKVYKSKADIEQKLKAEIESLNETSTQDSTANDSTSDHASEELLDKYNDKFKTEIKTIIDETDNLFKKAKNEPMKELILKMLNLDPAKRPALNEVEFFISCLYRPYIDMNFFDKSFEYESCESLDKLKEKCNEPIKGIFGDVKDGLDKFEKRLKEKKDEDDKMYKDIFNI